MASAADYQRQLQDMGQMPDFKTQIAQAYEKPVLKGITNEAAQLESQYLPTVFNTFRDMGTGAGDMSAAGKLAMIGQNIGNLGSKLNSNSSIQNFYGMQINDMANQQMQRYGMEQQRLKDLYGMAFQQEESQRQAAAAQAASGSNMQAIQDLMNQYQTAGGNLNGTSANVGGFQNVAALNAYRQARGLGPVSQEYFTNTYAKTPVAQPSMGQAVRQGSSNLWQQAWGPNGNMGQKAMSIVSAPGVPIISGLSSLFGR